MTRNAASFASVGNTRNQIATGAGVDSLGYGNALWNAVVTLNAAQARNALNQLSGDIHSSTAAAIVDDSRFLRAAAIDRLRDAFRSSGGGNPAMAYAAIGDAPAAPDASFAVWGRVVGAWGEASSDGNAAALARRTGGFFSGFDARVADEWRVGVLTGYTRSSLTSSSDASSAAIDTYHAGAYAGAQWGAFGLRTGAAYAWHHVDTSRTVAIPGFIDHLTAGYGANTAQVFGELGYNIALTQRAAIEPFAGLTLVDFRGNGFSEAGGAAALTAQARTTDVGFSTLGLRGAAGFDLAGMDASWKGSLGWRHVYGDVTPVTTFAFAGGDPFTVAGLPIARDAAAIDAGLDLGVARNVKVGIAYTGQIAKGFADHGAKAELNWKF
jgi:outer membrane autotransporter protein